MANSNEELSRARNPNENPSYIYICIYINIQNIEFKSCCPVRKRNSIALFRLWKFHRVISPSQTPGKDTMTIFIDDLEIFALSAWLALHVNGCSVNR